MVRFKREHPTVNLRFLPANSTKRCFYRAIEQAALERGVELTPEVVFDDFDTARIFVELDLGHAIVPAVHAHNFEKTGAGLRQVCSLNLPLGGD